MMQYLKVHLAAVRVPCNRHIEALANAVTKHIRIMGKHDIELSRCDQRFGPGQIRASGTVGSLRPRN